MKLGDRIKRYEKTFHSNAVRRMPLMIRVDGRSFHTFAKTAGLNKPFDHNFIAAMIRSATDLAREMQGFKAAYVQSDEATFCITDHDTIQTQGWFDYELPKIISLSAACMSVAFNHYFPTKQQPVFDSRAFSIPQDDVVNAFLWRAKDWERNSLQMYCRSFFSHKELHKKNRSDMHEMLHSIGKNWATDLSDVLRNGVFLTKGAEGEVIVHSNILPTYESINTAMGHWFDIPSIET